MLNLSINQKPNVQNHYFKIGINIGLHEPTVSLESCSTSSASILSVIFRLQSKDLFCIQDIEVNKMADYKSTWTQDATGSHN